MNTSPELNTQRWRKWFHRFLNAAKRLIPFVAGIAAAFIALVLYNVFAPATPPLNNQDVKNTVNQVLASATPAPAYSDLVYQIIQPSIVLIETQGQDASGNDQGSLGSGVIIDQSGDILTSLHVVSNSAKIQVVFADGSQSSAQVTVKQPENDIAVLRGQSTSPARSCRSGKSKCNASWG